MFQAQTFRPMNGRGFLPPVRLAGFRPAAIQPLAGPVLGYSLADGKAFYDRAKAAIAEFDSLAVRASKIAYKPERDSIISEYGLLEPDNNDKALNQRNDLQDYVLEVEKSVPPNYYVFIQDTSRPRNRLNTVEKDNVDFKADVKAAEQTYGSTPEPQVIIKEVPGGETDYTVPLLIGAGAVALALIL